jgi:nondiscriminating aspartyl-tRNA synthetase
MERILIGELGKHVGEQVLINGWVAVRRDQGKMVFFDFRDRSGMVQAVCLPNSQALGLAKEVTVESAIEAVGTINKRPDKSVSAGKQNGDIELVVEELTILNKAAVLPFDLDADFNLDTRLENRPLLLHTERERDIFTVQATILNAYRDALQKRGFTEFVAPALVGGDAEGGAAAFKVDYYYDTKAFLATSPQFYKELMVNAFERVFTFAKIFRGEKHATPRHLSELTQMDFEMGFIKDFRDVTRVLEEVVRDTVRAVGERHADIFPRFNTTVPLAPDPFPMLSLTEAQEIIRSEFKREIEDVNDMSPEDERQICEWARREKGSDFVFITGYPTKKRAFYTYEHNDQAPFSTGFDLLFRGLEINSGSQRMHDHDEMLERMRSRGLDPEKFSFYLQGHRYGFPPHGGCSTGLERFTMKMLDLQNIREATTFPRDMNRIDLSIHAPKAPGADPLSEKGDQ